MAELTAGLAEALHNGFTLPEMVIWGGDQKEIGRWMTDGSHENPEAFHEGALLKKRAMCVFTADQSDLEQDIKDYDALVNFLNEKYGMIAVPYTEAVKTEPLALGFAGFLYYPWATETSQ